MTQVGENGISAGELLEATKSICPVCKRTIDARVMREDGHVVLRKVCPEHGPFAALLSTDADAYVASLPYNKPGETPLARSARRWWTGVPTTAGCARTTSSTPARR